jgi:hypothetical protein
MLYVAIFIGLRIVWPLDAREHVSDVSFIGVDYLSE